MTIREVSESSLHASFFAAEGPSSPGVVVLGGSEGGRPRYLARLLASEGFASLALTYFGEKPLPRSLVEVPVEHVESAIGWLMARSETRGTRVGVVGASKGAELGLLAASLFPASVGAVVAYAPASVAFGGISFRANGRRHSSWSFRGTPLPFVPYPGRPMLCLQGISFARMYAAGLDHSIATDAATIPVERAHAPIMLISGRRDRLWPSSRMAGMIKARLSQHDSPNEVVHLDFPDAGHSIMPWAPAGELTAIGRVMNTVRLAGVGGLVALGGRPAANRQALQSAWPQVVEFLRKHLI
jgi:dienelactone hydrolase